MIGLDKTDDSSGQVVTVTTDDLDPTNDITYSVTDDGDREGIDLSGSAGDSPAARLDAVLAAVLARIRAVLGVTDGG